MSDSVSRACVFAHFDLGGLLDDSVIYYLEHLLPCLEVLHFVSTSRLPEDARQRLETLGAVVTERDNTGYDFMSYKLGLEMLDPGGFDEVLLCNNSVYGPFRSFEDIFAQMASVRCGFWGITSSEEIAPHLQSYFLLFRAPVISSESFARFWQSVQVLPDKREIIRQYEVGLSQALLAAGFAQASLVGGHAQGILRRFVASLPQYLARFRQRWRQPELYRHLFSALIGRQPLQVNPTQMEWRSLLVDEACPFIKIELLRDNPLGVADVDEALAYIGAHSSYPVDLITRHLARVSAGR